MYIGDTDNHRVRIVTPDGVIQTLTGTEAGFTGDAQDAAQAKLSSPTALALDEAGDLVMEPSAGWPVPR